MKYGKWLIISLLATITLIVPVVYIAHALNTPPVATQTSPVSITLNADTIFNLVNQERINAGLKPLIRNDGLNATAQARADDMVARNYFGHFDPMTGENLVVIKKTNPQCTEASENIGQSYGLGNNNQRQLNWWLNSKPHHDAILDSRYTLTGVAISGDKVVQHFCISK